MSLFGGANLAGAVIVFTYLGMTGQTSLVDVRDDLERGSLLFGTYLVVIGLVLAIVVAKRLRSLDWWYERRGPTEDERRFTMLLPRRLAVLSMQAWLGGTVVFSVAGAIDGDDARHVFRTAAGAVLGGLSTSAMCYLLVERVLRPMFATVLALGPAPVQTLGVRPRLALAWALGSGVVLLGIAVSPIQPEQSANDLAILGAIGLVSGALMTGIATRSVSDRLTLVRNALARVQAGDLDVEVQVDEAGEIGTLQAGVNEMVRGLQERQVLRDLFGRHVGEEVARNALEQGVHLGGEVREVSVLFVDVAGSTWLAATRPPTEVVAMLNDLFRTVVDLVGQEGGWVDKFEGDAALCVFGAPNDRPGHAAAALRSARRLSGELVRLQRRHPELDIGIGVSSGPAVAGNVGSEKRFEYTVIGDPVNEAARLTEAAKTRPSRVIAAKRAVEAAGDESRHWQPAEVIALRGRPLPTETYEPMDIGAEGGKDIAHRVTEGRGNV